MGLPEAPHLELSPSVVWTAAGLLLSLQAGATIMRAAREDGVEGRGRGDPLWMPPCEMLNLLSLVACVLGVFVLPLLAQSRQVRFRVFLYSTYSHASNKDDSRTCPQATETGFCVYILLYGGVPLATLGHHEAFAARDRSGAYCPAQERNSIIGVCAAVCAYLAVALATVPSEGKGAVLLVTAVTVPACSCLAFFVWRASEGSVEYSEVAGGVPALRRRRGTTHRGSASRRGVSPGRTGSVSPRSGSPLGSSVLSAVPRMGPDRSYAAGV